LGRELLLDRISFQNHPVSNVTIRGNFIVFNLSRDTGANGITSTQALQVKVMVRISLSAAPA